MAERSSRRDDVLKADTLPKSVIVVGAGAVGVEFASMYHDLGVQVTLLEYLPADRAARGPRREQGAPAQLRARGIKVITSNRFDPQSVTRDENGICLMTGPEGKEPQELRAEKLLVAAGRATDIEDVGLETTKAEVERGIVKVDGRQRTREPHLYAIGDIVGGLQLAHTAAHEGIVAAHVIAGEKDVHPVDYVKQPRATYCRPEIAASASPSSSARSAASRSRSARCRSRPSPRR